jgi:hypothetical protein
MMVSTGQQSGRQSPFFGQSLWLMLPLNWADWQASNGLLMENSILSYAPASIPEAG